MYISARFNRKMTVRSGIEYGSQMKVKRGAVGGHGPSGRTGPEQPRWQLTEAAFLWHPLRWIASKWEIMVTKVCEPLRVCLSQRLCVKCFTEHQLLS